ncbi:MAG: ribosome recycling factor [Sedimentisphaerales bacterium]|nr:ribosome recycling factor [Sedimentisphaerales bacterium]
MSIKDSIKDCEEKMGKAITHMQEELKGFRTGRASPALVENLKVDYYGSPTPLRQLASISAPQPDMLVIKPYDASAIPAIEKAIKTSELSLAPITEGKMVRLNLPPLSEERRRQLVNQAKHVGEQAKISIRNIRRDVIKDLERQEKEKLITEDDLDHGKKQVEDLTKKYIEKVDTLVAQKSREIMEG